jgi:predicted O-methyltransferase YrrM
MRETDQKQGLLELCQNVKAYLGDNLSIVEIGSYCGASGEIIASSFPNSILNCVDPWEKYTEDNSTWDLNKQELELQEAEKIFESVMSKYSNIRKNKMSSYQYSLSVPTKSIDFIYIDGNHQYSSIKEDLTNWFPKIKTGGIIAGHDFPHPPVQKALSEFFNESPINVFKDGSWFYFVKK